MSVIKIGLDVHGVINKDPDLFRRLTTHLRKNGVEIHILTGVEIGDLLLKELSNIGVEYDHLFSITSYHKSIGTYITYKNDDKTQPLIAPPKWNRSKADYAKKVGLHIHLDDSPLYKEYFHWSTQYVIYTDEVRRFLKTMVGGYGRIS